MESLLKELERIKSEHNLSDKCIEDIKNLSIYTAFCAVIDSKIRQEVMDYVAVSAEHDT